jgi:hypothetical protein
MNEALVAAIYSGAERYNLNCTKVVVLEDEIEPFRVYVVTNERKFSGKSGYQWTAVSAWPTLAEAANLARSISDGFPGAHYLGRGPW